MNRPELVPGNHEAIFEFYRAFEPNQKIQRFGFALMHAVYRSEVHYDADAASAIREHLEGGGSLIVAPNHQSNADTPTIGGLIYEDAFALLRDNVIAPGKASLFRWPILGKFLEHMGVHPTFRGKDYQDDEEGQLLRKTVADSVVGLNIDYVNNGGSIAIFPEGTRNRGNPLEIQKLRTGIGNIAVGVEDPANVLIVPMGFAYRWQHVKLSPVVVVNEPFSPESMTRDQVLAETQTRIQSATIEAFDLAA